MTKKTSVFVIDDDQSIIDFLTVTLSAAGFEVSSSTCASKAVETALSLRPDCIIVDLMMPGKDGFDLVRELRLDEAFASTKIIVISSKSYEFDRRRSVALGADGYITKPLDAKTISGQVERILESRIDMTFWGVRGTLPVSGQKTLKYGGSTSCVSLELPGGHFFIFDAGTGIKTLSDKMAEWHRYPVIAKIFISHPHWDHINALPFFAPMFGRGNEFEICGASHGDITMRELISAQMDGVYFPITLKEFAARVYFRNLGEETIEFGNVKVTTKLLLGYRVCYEGRSICYITDNELYLEDSRFYNPQYEKQLADFVRGADALITDTTYTDEEYKTKIGWGHSSVSQVAKLAHTAEVDTLYLFHHDPDQDDDAIDAKLAEAQAALKGLKSKTKCLAPRESEAFRL